MKKTLFRLVGLFAYCAAVFAVTGIYPAQIINMPELLLVIAGSFAFSVPALFLPADRKARRFTIFCAEIGGNALVTGSLASLLLVLWYFSDPQKISAGENLSRSLFVVLAFGCRPLLYGLILRIVFFGIGGFLPKSGAAQSQEPNAAVQPEKNAGSSPDGILSRRECEVARLAGQGLTNAQISEELYISPVTVKRHMANIFEKTGVKSRRELAEKLAGNSKNFGF